MVVFPPCFLFRPGCPSGDLWAARSRGHCFQIAVAPAPAAEARVEFPRCTETIIFLGRHNAGTGSRCRTSMSKSAGLSRLDRLALAFMTSMKRTKRRQAAFPATPKPGLRFHCNPGFREYALILGVFPRPLCPQKKPRHRRGLLRRHDFLCRNQAALVRPSLVRASWTFGRAATRA